MRRVLLGFMVATVLTTAVFAAPPEYRSPGALALDKSGHSLYIAETTAHAVDVWDTASQKITRTIALKGDPSGLALTPDDKILCVTLGGAEGEVAFVNTETGVVTGTVAAGHTPMAPVISADGATLYVCNRFSSSVSVVDLATKQVTGTFPVLREAVAAVLSPDAKTVFVANLLSAGPSNGDAIAAAVSVVDTTTKQKTDISLANGASGVRGICMSPDGKFVYATHILARYTLPTTQLERGWMNTNALSIIDASACKLVTTVLLDEVELGATNPWAVVCSGDGKYLCVSHAGSREISVIDRAALHAKLDAVAGGKKASEVSSSLGDVANDLSFLAGIRRRIKLSGTGPRALAISGTQLYVADYFSDAVETVNIDPSINTKVKMADLGPKSELTPERKGETLFNDASLCFQQWQSCASCHPDARIDGLNWDLVNDGIGNPKNSRSMLLSHVTPPVMTFGVRDKAETAVRSGIKYIQFAVRPEEDAVAIEAYLKSMKPVPSPHLEKGNLSAAAERGKALFEKAGCAQCHTAPLYTDMKQYDLGTTTEMDKGKPVDTPTLVEVWRTAPYLHDGRATTIFDMLKKFNAEDKHGLTSNLTDEQLKDLEAFVLSL